MTDSSDRRSGGRGGDETAGGTAHEGPADRTGADDHPGEEVFRRGHSPGDEPRPAEPDAPADRTFDADGEGNVAGPSPGSVRMPVEPGSPSAEGVLFVLLGVVLTLFVFARLAGV